MRCREHQKVWDDTRLMYDTICRRGRQPLYLGGRQCEFEKSKINSQLRCNYFKLSALLLRDNGVRCSISAVFRFFSFLSDQSADFFLCWTLQFLIQYLEFWKLKFISQKSSQHIVFKSNFWNTQHLAWKICTSLRL